MFRRILALALGAAVAVGAAGCGVARSHAGAAPSGQAAGATASARPPGPADVAAELRGHWASQPTPARLDRLSLMGVSCGGDGTRCVAVGIACRPHDCVQPEASVILSTADGGESWVRQPVPAGVGNLAAVSCATATQCVVGGDRAPFGQHSGVFLITGNGGAPWRVVADPGMFSPSGISCPTVTTCFAVGHSPGKTAAVAATSDGGATWVAQALPAALGSLTAISCPSAADCVALGFSAAGHALALATTDGGRSWAAHAMPDGSLTAISCPTVTACLAVGVDVTGTAGMIAATDDGGKTWTQGAAPQGVVLSGVSCPSATACAAVGSQPVSQSRAVAVTTNGGGTWTPVPIPAGLGNLFGVSCAPVGDCTAVGSWRLGGVIAEGPYIVSNQPS